MIIWCLLILLLELTLSLLHSRRCDFVSDIVPIYFFTIVLHELYSSQHNNITAAKSTVNFYINPVQFKDLCACLQ